MAELYPLVCRPLYVERVWGGRRLARLYGKPLPDNLPIGESWEAADLAEGASRIGNGPLEGQTLTDASAELGLDLVGTAWPEGRFPLLIKLLDAAEDLSVQVHPSAEDCRRYFPEAHSKDESWVVVDAEPGAAVLYGFRAGVSQPEFEQALGSEALLGLLNRIPVKAGDVLRVAPGTVHALGAGVAVLEVQEPSDTTYRLYDYGRGRELHVDQGRQVTRVQHFEQPLVKGQAHDRAWGTWELLVDAPSYRLERVSAEAPLRWAIDPRSVQVLCVLEGAALVGWADCDLRVSAGDTVLLPARLGEVRLRPMDATVAIVAGAGGARLVDEISEEANDVEQ